MSVVFTAICYHSIICVTVFTVLSFHSVIYVSFIYCNMLSFSYICLLYLLQYAIIHLNVFVVFTTICYHSVTCVCCIYYNMLSFSYLCHCIYCIKLSFSYICLLYSLYYYAIIQLYMSVVFTVLSYHSVIYVCCMYCIKLSFSYMCICLLHLLY